MPELSDMPELVMEKIVKKLDMFDRISLTQTSRSFHAFVENQKLFHQTLKIDVSRLKTIVSLGGSVEIQYEKDHVAHRKVFKNRQTLVRGVPYWKQAIRDIRQILKNPKLHLDTLTIGLTVNKGYIFDELENELKFSHYLNVKNLILDGYPCNRLSKILSTLKPGYLTTIDIGNDWNRNVDSMNTVFETEQWKQAKGFTMRGAYFIWPWHHLYHLKEFTVRLEKLSVEDIREMKEFLFKSPDFKKCSLTVSHEINKSIIAQVFGNALRKSQYVYHYPIPNSTDYFEIKVGGWTLEIQRKKS